MEETYKICDVEQIRLLADPLKLRILRAFAKDPRTTKQVAAAIGENVTKLYRHVDALHDAGLLEIAEERQKRGTIERTFRAVARRFEADPGLFSEEAGEECTHAARELLRSCEDEILNAIANTDDDERKAIIMRFRCKVSTEKIDELRASLNEWIESVPKCDEGSDEDAVDIGGLIAFYEIDSGQSTRCQ